MQLTLTLGLLASARKTMAQQDLTGRAILSYQTLDEDLLTSHGFHQTYDLRLERALSEAMRFRLSFRGEGNDGTSRLDDLYDQRTQFRQYQPGAELVWNFAPFQLRGTYDDIRTESTFGDVSGTRALRRLTAELSWRGEELPGLTLYGEQRRLKDALAQIDNKENVALETLDWTWRGLTLAQTVRLQTLDDGGAAFARKSEDVQGNARYDNTFFGGRATVSANVLGAVTRLDERTGASQPVSVPIRVPIPRALYAQDDTPLDGRDRPLQDVPALIDGDFLKPAGIPLGPDGTSYQNIAVDLGRIVDVDEFRIYVRDVGGAPVRSPGFVRFDAYRSEDGLVWIPVPGGTQTSFNVALSAFVADFAKLSARYVKVVSFGTNVLDTQVTEIEVYQHQLFGAGEVKRTDIRLWSGSATAAGKPTDWLTLSYYGLFNANTQTSTTRPELRTHDSDQIAAVQVDPSKTVNLIGRYEKHLVTQTDGYSQSLDAVSAVAHWAPLRSIDVTAEYRRSNEDLAGRVSTSDGLHGHLYLRFLKSFDLSLDGDYQKESQASDNHPATHRSLTAVTYAQLTDDLRMTANASLQRTSYENGTPDEIASGLLLPASHDERYWVETSYRTGPQLFLSARLGWASSNLYSGVTQAYRVEWYPFGAGTVSIGTVYDEDLDSISNRRFRRVQILPRWVLNKSMTIDLNYTVMSTYRELVDSHIVLGQSSRSFWANLTLAF